MSLATTRRTLLGAAVAVAAVPAAFAAPSAATPMATVVPAAPVASGSVRALWDEVVNLTIRMGAHADALGKANPATGLPGWMYVSGEANDLGNARYDALVAILKAAPASAEDLDIMTRAASHCDIVQGPVSFANQRVAMAEQRLMAA